MVTHKKRPLNWDPGVGRQRGALQSGDTEMTWGRGGGDLHFKPQPTSYPGVAASQGALPDHGLPWGPTPIPGHESCHSPSGRVNSRKVGSETTVWEMVCTGSNTQVTSLGRQDLTQRTVSVFSWRSLRGARTQEWMRKLEPAHLQRPGSREEQQEARRGPAGSETAPSENCNGLHSPAAPWGYLRALPANRIGTQMPETHPGFHLPSLCISEALLFANTTD